jgi:hypothetical protein
LKQDKGKVWVQTGESVGLSSSSVLLFNFEDDDEDENEEEYSIKHSLTRLQLHP